MLEPPSPRSRLDVRATLDALTYFTEFRPVVMGDLAFIANGDAEYLTQAPALRHVEALVVADQEEMHRRARDLMWDNSGHSPKSSSGPTRVKRGEQIHMLWGWEGERDDLGDISQHYVSLSVIAGLPGTEMGRIIEMADSDTTIRTIGGVRFAFARPQTALQLDRVFGGNETVAKLRLAQRTPVDDASLDPTRQFALEIGTTNAREIFAP